VENAIKLRDQLRLSNAEFDTLVLAANAPREGVHPHASEREAKVALYRYGPKLMRKQLLINWARSGISPDDPHAGELYAFPDKWEPPKFPISGADVLEAGVPPGPRVGEILDQLERRWIEADFAWDRDRLLAELANGVSDAGQA